MKEYNEQLIRREIFKKIACQNKYRNIKSGIVNIPIFIKDIEKVQDISIPDLSFLNGNKIVRK